MAKHDVIVVGGGPAGLCNAAILAKNGKKVLLLEKTEKVGGRAVEVPFKGYTLNFGYRLVEDAGSGISRLFQHVDRELRHGPAARGLPFYVDGKWKPVQDFYAKDRAVYRKIIKEIVEDLSWDDIEKLDDQPIRPWIRKRTDSEGILMLFEFTAMAEAVTVNWWDHSVSEQLWMRKLHFTERGMASYCFWPLDGWQKIWNDLAEAVRDNGGEIKLNANVREIVIENGKVKGVEVEKHAPIMATDYPETIMIEASCVISTLPWENVLATVDEGLLPGWYVDQIKFMTRDEMRGVYLEIYAALPGPLPGFQDREMPSWLRGPRTGLGGVCVDISTFAPNLTPSGEHLYMADAFITHEHLKLPRRELDRLFAEFEKENEELFPIFKQRLWTERHIVFNPTLGPLWKPGAVGRYKPDVEVPALEGLYCAGDIFRGRSIGVDRAARTAMTVAEKIMGRPIPDFKESWHY